MANTIVSKGILNAAAKADDDFKTHGHSSCNNYTQLQDACKKNPQRILISGRFGEFSKDLFDLTHILAEIEASSSSMGWENYAKVSNKNAAVALIQSRMITDLSMVVDAATIDCYHHRTCIGIDKTPAGLIHNDHPTVDQSDDPMISDLSDRFHSTIPIYA